jgi:hypothetical protein
VAFLCFRSPARRERSNEEARRGAVCAFVAVADMDSRGRVREKGRGGSGEIGVVALSGFAEHLGTWRISDETDNPAESVETSADSKAKAERGMGRSVQGTI